MSKWSIFLNMTNYCYSQKGTGNRPCDLGTPCDRCEYDEELQKHYEEVKNTIDVSKYCSCCSHLLSENEEDVCSDCKEEFESYFI